MSDINCQMSETAGRCYHCGEEINFPLEAVYINRGIHSICNNDARNQDVMRCEIARLKSEIERKDTKIKAIVDQYDKLYDYAADCNVFDEVFQELRSEIKK